MLENTYIFTPVADFQVIDNTYFNSILTNSNYFFFPLGTVHAKAIVLKMLLSIPVTFYWLGSIRVLLVVSH